MRSTPSERSPRTATAPTPPDGGSRPARRRLIAGTGSLALALSLGLTPATAHASPAPETVLQDLVTVDAIRTHLQNLDTIAYYNGGNRAHGAPGYDVAALYLEDQLKRAGYTPERHTYEFDRWREHGDPVLERLAPTGFAFVQGEHFTTMSYSGAGDTTAPGVGVSTDTDDSGCDPAHFSGFPAGSVALIKRGACTFQQKAQNAADAGASGAVIYNNADEIFTGTLGEESDIPVVSASLSTGEELLLGGDELELRLAVDASVQVEAGYSILAETEGGRDDNVVMVGAHLDSVDEGPGINDNGSGSAFLLEAARQFGSIGGTPENKVRFAWWGTEELGLVGSTEYVADLSAQEADDIALYLNFDMIGSHNYGRFILDGRSELAGSSPAPSGSGAIQKLFEDYFAGQDLVAEASVLSGRSDYAPFMRAGIPAGGLFSGADGTKTAEQVEYYGGTAGERYDPYYHTADDTLENINWASVAELSGGGAHAIEAYSQSTLPVNGVFRVHGTEQVRFDQKADRWLR